METQINKHLGQTSQYIDTYDPTLLVREARQNNRTYLGITDDNLPFVGYDTWNAYEVTTLVKSGLPVSCIVKIVYPADNKYIVESKSLKLYLNSFTSERLGKDVDSVLYELKLMIINDLRKLLECNVHVEVWESSIIDLELNTNDTWSFGYTNLEKMCPHVECKDFIENPDLLKVIQNSFTQSMAHAYYSDLLRSRCKVTQQQDTGNVYIYYRGDKMVTPESLLQYIVSFRNECHFHEEICEAIYKRLYDKLQPEELRVMCLYNRRGGIDINPQRASKEELIDLNLKRANIPHIKTARQ